MGGVANLRLTNVVAAGIATVIVSLNLFLLYETSSAARTATWIGPPVESWLYGTWLEGDSSLAKRPPAKEEGA